ncbi:MAG: acyl carrier protein [Polaromonas sp.]|uniref:acyl carrier protein n=1 Tax=Burkholderiales TaxID=80840 RepID=UPI002489118D|nr:MULTISPECIES: acyl carrier protein [Burkholderiales]MDI1268497.1 acyl carrier protein [Polaromonas sp.]MDP2449429.1 acyl carrier protein [Polaromonas sp.]MDP3188855.1 acyl carrier protein [Limnobacter sp.]MDP3754383.1 acyl carrier protein [Polaromonas sp.]MDP3828086.1 acyl carrier protein [Polaromonas sp.]
MTNDRPALTATVLGILRTIAPEVEPEAFDPARPLRHQVDLDSMDWLNFLVALHERLSVSIPEADYAQLVTLDNVLDYLLARPGPAGG